MVASIQQKSAKCTIGERQLCADKDLVIREDIGPNCVMVENKHCSAIEEYNNFAENVHCFGCIFRTQYCT